LIRRRIRIGFQSALAVGLGVEIDETRWLNAAPVLLILIVKLLPTFLALFAFCFAMTVGTAWQIFEFGVDRFFGTTMQMPTDRDASGLVDTMRHLTVNAVGAWIVVSLGYRSAQRGAGSLVSRLIRHFVKMNPKLFPDSPTAKGRGGDR
jgi:hypothetical protein